MRGRSVIAGVLFALGLLLPAGAGPGDRKEMEIVSRLGAQATVKLYSGEQVDFFAREVRRDVRGILGGGGHLKGVTFILYSWPYPDPETMGIVRANPRREIGRWPAAEEVWGASPSSVTLKGGAVGGSTRREQRTGAAFGGSSRSPGRYVLRAEKDGFEPAEIVVNIASFALDDIESNLTREHYAARFSAWLVDPSEPTRSIPLRVESLDAQGRLVDVRTDVVLAPITGHPGRFEANRVIRVGSAVTEAYRDRVARSADDPLPRDFPDQKALRIVEGGLLRIAFRDRQIVYNLPL